MVRYHGVMPSALRLRRVTIEDLETVRAIEQAAFTTGWPPTAFEHEIAHNGRARYVLLERDGEPGDRQALGFAGLWLMVDEAHVVTVAVRPEERRNAYGRLLVHALVAIAADAAMNEATLEVRASNTPARALYHEYGFHDVGLRKKYYADNGEDAVIMTTEAFDSEPFGLRYALLEAELRERFPALFEDAFEPARWGFG